MDKFIFCRYPYSYNGLVVPNPISTKPTTPLQPHSTSFSIERLISQPSESPYHSQLATANISAAVASLRNGLTNTQLPVHPYDLYRGLNTNAFCALAAAAAARGQVQVTGQPGLLQPLTVNTGFGLEKSSVVPNLLARDRLISNDTLQGQNRVKTTST